MEAWCLDSISVTMRSITLLFAYLLLVVTSSPG